MKFPQPSLQKHERLRRQLEGRLRSIRARYADRMSCLRGCSRCCRGLFDISIPDALRIAEGFRMLPGQIRDAVADRAAAIQLKLSRENPDFRPPYLLDSRSPDRIDRFVESIGDVRCPFLDDRDSCLIYEKRPIACLLEGIPMVDAQGGPFGDWCELNFKEGISSGLAEELRLDYYEIQEIEQDVTIFIPSVIVASKQWAVDRAR